MKTWASPGWLSTATMPPIAGSAPHDPEAEAGSDRPFAPVSLVEVEALECALRVTLVEAGAGVLDAKTPGAATTPTSRPQESAATRLDEVGDDLENVVGVGDPGRGAW